MSFGDKRLDKAYDEWATRSPPDPDEVEFEDIAEECSKENSPIALQDYTLKKKINLHEKQKCISCGFLFWKKHTCRKDKK